VADVAPPMPVVSAPAAPVSATPPGEGRRGVQRTLGFVGLGAGVVAIGASVYFAFHERSLWSDAQQHCDASNRCDDLGFNLNQDARRSGDFATVTFTAGLALAAVGTLAILLAPSSSASSSASSAPASTGFHVAGGTARFVFHVP